MNIYDIIGRAESLRKETALNAISPERAGGIMSDTLKYLNEFQIQSSSIGLDKIYTSITAMNADDNPASDLTGQPMKAGQLAVIVSEDSSSSDTGKVYRFNGTAGSWSFIARIGNINDAVDLLRDLGKYPTSISLPMSVGVSGKYVDTDGQEQANSSMSISAPLEFKAGNTYLFGSSEAVGTGVSLFARKVTNTYDKVIAYTYEYDQEGRISKATADYDPSLVYTYTYDGEGNATIKDKDGETMQDLPATHEVTESFYEPLFRTNDSTMPESGYYLFLCTQDMEVVVSGYTSDITGKNMLGVRYGALASIATNFVGTPGQKVIAQAFAELYAMVEALSDQVDKAGHLKVDLLDMADLPLVCGEKMYSTGEGAPTSPPTVPFQEYYDNTDDKFYKAKGVLPDVPTIGDWIALN